MGALAVELIFVGEVEHRAELLDQARALAVETGDDLAFVDAIVGRFVAFPRPAWSADAARRDFDDMSTALTAAERLGDAAGIASTHVNAGFFALTLNDGPGVRDHVARLRELADTAQNNIARRGRLLIEQMVATIDGRLVEAQSLSVEMFRVWSAAGMPEAVTYQGTTGVATRREQGRLVQIIDGWSAFLAMHPGASSADATIAFALAETGDIDAAATRLEAASHDGFCDIPADAGWPMAVGMWSEVAAMAADRASATVLHEVAAPWDGLQLATGGITTGPTARHLARLETVLDRSLGPHRCSAPPTPRSGPGGPPPSP
jgi:hypothetical protein